MPEADFSVSGNQTLYHTRVLYKGLGLARLPQHWVYCITVLPLAVLWLVRVSAMGGNVQSQIEGMHFLGVLIP